MNLQSPPMTGIVDLDIWLQQLAKELRKISKLETAYLSIDTDTTLGKEAITIKQDDEDKAFIKFDGTVAADNSKNIASGTPTLTTKRQIRVDVEGAEYWIQAGTWA